MSRVKITSILIPILVVTGLVLADEISWKVGRNQLGLGRNIGVYPRAVSSQHIDLDASADTVVVLNAPGLIGESFFRILFLHGDTGDQDTLWTYIYNAAGAISDSVPKVGVNGTLDPISVNLSEGDSIHIYMNSSGVETWARAECTGSD